LAFKIVRRESLADCWIEDRESPGKICQDFDAFWCGENILVCLL